MGKISIILLVIPMNHNVMVDFGDERFNEFRSTSYSSFNSHKTVIYNNSCKYNYL